MVETLPMKDVGLVGYRIAGRIDDEQVDAAVRALDEAAEGADKVCMYIELEDVQGMTLRAFLKDLFASAKRTGMVKKVAVVSDRKWVEAGAKLDDLLLPDTEVRHFRKPYASAARSWVELR